jgi:hypothetical protein
VLLAERLLIGDHWSQRRRVDVPPGRRVGHLAEGTSRRRGLPAPSPAAVCAGSIWARTVPSSYLGALSRRSETTGAESPTWEGALTS